MARSVADDLNIDPSWLNAHFETLAKQLEVVDRQLEYLVERRYPGAERALDYFDDLRDEADL